MSTNLDVEMKVYRDNQEQWCKEHLTEFVAIHNTDVLGFFPSWTIAFVSGHKAYDRKATDDHFLVRQVLVTDDVYFIF